MMKKSFAENEKIGKIPAHVRMIREMRETYMSMFKFEGCQFKSPMLDEYPIEEYVRTGDELRTMNWNTLREDGETLFKIPWP